MLRYAPMSPGPGFAPMRAGLYYAQRLAVLPWLRRGVARAIAACSPRAPTRLNDDVLERDGLAPLPGLCPPGQAAALREWFAARDVVGPDGAPTPLAALPPGTAAAPYPMATILGHPDILALVNHPLVLARAAAYLGCKPTLSSLGVRWSFPTDRPNDVQRFHRDPDDWRFLKLFIYLTDVPDAAAGPHVYVRGSHHGTGRLRARAYSRADILRQYDEAAIHPVLGAAGTAFMADTYGIHAGAVPRGQPRLIVQAQYSVLPIYAFAYQPLPMALPPELDPYVNRLLLRPMAA